MALPSAGDDLAEELEGRAVDAGGDHQQIVGLECLLACADRGPVVGPGYVADPLRDDPRAARHSQPQHVRVQSGPRGLAQVARARAAVHSADTTAWSRRRNGRAAGIHVHHVGVDVALHYAGRQVDAIFGHQAHQALRDDACAAVTALRARLCKVARLVDVHPHPPARLRSHVQ